MNIAFTRQALVGVVLLLLLGGGVFLSRSSWRRYFDNSDPREELLEANFRKHESEFQDLLTMSQTDRKLVRIANDFTWLDTNAAWPRPESEWGISRERWDQYRGLFKTLGVPGGMLRENKGTVTYFIVFSGGLVTNGFSKGYAYSDTEPAPLVSSLDDPASWPKGNRVVFKHLKGDWYLFCMS